MWKAQIPYFARHCRVLTFDPRGSERSDRPRDLGAYAETEFVADALAVMDATDTDRAVLVSLSRGAQRALLLAAEHPERVLAAAFVDPCFPASPFGGLRWRIMAHPRLRPALLIRPPVAAGWLKFNGAHWRADYLDFVSGSSIGVQHAALDPADRGRDRLGARDRRGDAIASTSGTSPRSRFPGRFRLSLAPRVRFPVPSHLDSRQRGHGIPADVKGVVQKQLAERLLTVTDGGQRPAGPASPLTVNIGAARLHSERGLRAFTERFAQASRRLHGRLKIVVLDQHLLPIAGGHPMSVAEDRYKTDRTIKEMLGLVPEFFQRVPDYLLPTEWASFKSLVLSDQTAIPNKYKEMIGLAVSGATRCRYCAYFHTEAARLFGATEDEINETALVAKHTMGWSTYLNTLQFDYDQFTSEFDQIAAHIREQQAVGAPA